MGYITSFQITDGSEEGCKRHICVSVCIHIYVITYVYYIYMYTHIYNKYIQALANYRLENIQQSPAHSSRHSFIPGRQHCIPGSELDREET